MAAKWRKVVVSGSIAELNTLSVDNNVNITGSLLASSSVFLQGLTNSSQPSIVSIDPTTGQLYYQGTGSFTADSASFAQTASYVNTLNQNVVISGSLNASGSITAILPSQSFSYLVGYDPATGALSYDGTGSVVPVTASYAISGSHAINADTGSSVGVLNQAVIISGSLAVNTSTGNSFDINADTFIFTGSLSTSGSVSFVLTEVSKSYVVGYDTASGQLTYQTAVDNADTASFAISASFASTASYVNTLNQNVIISGTLDLALYSGSTSNLAIAGNGFNQTYLSTNGAIVLNPGSGGVGMAGTNQYITLGYIQGQTAGSYLTGSFTGSFKGDGSGLTGISASVLLNALSQSTGITAFNYNGSAAAAVQVSGSDTLSSSSVVLWTGNAFQNSSITDGGQVTINNAGGVLIQAGGLYVTGASTFHDNVVMQGDLTVAGTASFQNTQNLAIADQFILLNSGSATFQDSGIIIAAGNAGNSGSAFFLETAATTTGSPLNGRFAVAGGILPDATTVTAESYMNTTVISGSVPNDATPPAFGGSGLGQGNMWVNSDTSDIWIYA